MALKSMSIDRLTSLREKVDTTLRTKITEARRDLEVKLSKLSRVNLSRGRAFPRGYGLVAPKYRNPDNPSETWAGRGLKPHWLVAALKSGKKLEDFLIARPRERGSRKNGKRQKGAQSVRTKIPEASQSSRTAQSAGSKGNPANGGQRIARSCTDAITCVGTASAVGAG